MVYDYDFLNKIIDVPYGVSTVTILELLTDIRNAELTEQGICYGQIATASGGESLGGSVYVGVTLELLDNWQVRFASGNYIAKIIGGNLVGGIDGDPIAYSSGVQVLLVQSAASTIVITSDGLNATQATLLQTAASEAAKGRKMQTNKAVIAQDGLAVVVYDDDGNTPLHVFSISEDKLVRVPQ